MGNVLLSRGLLPFFIYFVCHLFFSLIILSLLLTVYLVSTLFEKASSIRSFKCMTL